MGKLSHFTSRGLPLEGKKVDPRVTGEVRGRGGLGGGKEGVWKKPRSV